MSVRKEGHKVENAGIVSISQQKKGQFPKSGDSPFSLNKVIFLVGPTAVGKSRIAVYLAKKINAEIISCDSMQIYRGMDIITSKPPASLRRQVKHHLIGTVSPLGEYDVAAYRRDALKKIGQVLRRGKVPLFTGGTGLYVSILVDGIFSVECRDERTRRQLLKAAEEKGNAFLHERLSQIDPEAAGRIHENDTRRIVRALEVFRVSGKPISELQKQRKGLAVDYDVRTFCLDMPRQALYERIERRVDKMFSSGLADEAEELLRRKLSRTAAQAIGIKEIKGYLDGHYDLDEAKSLIKKNTRQYAKRQLTWFRKDKRVEWIQLEPGEKPSSVADMIIVRLRDRGL